VDVKEGSPISVETIVVPEPTAGEAVLAGDGVEGGCRGR
jgi:hypothetical protein